LQCYEGLDLGQAAYEWNYPRQLLSLQAHGGAAGTDGEAGVEGIFRESFLLKRPLLQAIDAANERAPVLLIDELDRADEEFESFLLELLSDFQITIPELGTLRAKHRPVVILTSNRTRDVHDALKRRCIYLWIDYPSFEKEVEIVRRHVPGLPEHLSRRVVAFTQRLRREDLYKLPGVAETVDWAEALEHLGVRDLDAAVVGSTLGLLLKYQEDIEKLRGPLAEQLLGASD
jgi:MoxR-like ATPase